MEGLKVRDVITIFGYVYCNIYFNRKFNCLIKETNLRQQSYHIS